MVDARRDIRIRYIGDDATGSATRSVGRNVSSIEQSYQRLNSRIAITNRLVAGVTLGIGSGNVVSQLSTLQDSTARLSAVTNTLAKDQAFLGITSKKLSLDIEAATASFARLKVLEDAGALGTGDSEQFIIGLGDAFARFGAGAAQQENVLYGLAQALGQGTLQAQELNQVVEPLPGLLNDIAAEAGLTAGEYRRLIKEGNTLSTTFKRDILGALRSYAGTAEALSGNIRQTLTRLSNDYKNTLLVFNEPITAGVDQVGETLGAALRTIAANAENVATAIQVSIFAAVAAYGSKALRGLNAYTTAFVASSATRVRVTVAEAQAYAVKAARDAEAAAVEGRSIAATQARAAASTTAAAQEVAAGKAIAVQKQQQLVSELQLAAVEKASRAERARATAQQAAANAAASAQRIVTLREVQALRAAELQRAGTAAQVEASQNRLTAATKRLEIATLQLRRAEEAAATTSARSAAARQAQIAAGVAASAATRGQVQANFALFAAKERVIQQQARLTAATAAQIPAEVALANAVRGRLAATQGLNVVLAAQAVVARGATVALTALKGAYALIGGGVGVAVIAAIAITALIAKLKKQDPAVTEAKDRLRTLVREYEALTQATITAGGTTFEADGLTEAERELLKAAENAEQYRGELKAAAEATSGFENLTNRARLRLARLKDLFAGTSRNVEALKETFVELDQQAEANQTFKGISEQQRQLGTSSDALALVLVRGGREAADALAPLITKNDVLKAQLDELNFARTIEQRQGNDDRVRQYDRAIAAAREEQDVISGAAKAREGVAAAAKRQVAEQQKIIEGLDTEEQKINRLFGEQSRTIKVGIEIAQQNGAEDEAARLLAVQAQLQLKRENDVTEIRRKGFEERATIARDELQIELDAAEALAAQQAKYREQVLARDARIDPVGTARKIRDAELSENAQKNLALIANERELQEQLVAIRNAAVQIPGARGESEANSVAAQAIQARLTLERQAQVASDAERANIAADGERAVQAAKDTVAAEARATREREQLVPQIDAGVGAFKGLIENLKPQIGQYIQLTESMTDAERAQAIRSNATNRKRFEQNKKVLQAQALADTFAAANRSIAVGGFAGISQAIAVTAFGLANVRRIQKSSFGSGSVGSGGGAGAGGGGSEIQNQRVENANRRSGVGTEAQNVVIVTTGGGSAQQAVADANALLPSLTSLLASQDIRIRGGKLSTSDATLLRRR